MRVLFIEDSTRLQRSICTALRHSGYAVDGATDGEEGLWLAESNDYDVIVLDIMLPGLDGLEILRRLRQQEHPAQILMLTARDTVEDRVRGLQLGAEDYLVKPFALEELLARIQALCRRRYALKTTRLVIADLELDMATKTVRRADRPIDLAPREYALLELLALRRGQVVSRQEIEAHIYDEQADPMSNVVDSAVYLLRKKLSLPGRQPLIHTRRGLGYILDEEPACTPSVES
ncbi:MAG: response regulator transcription factor [Verrucomicrobia bacterium]|nr:response regulator transcription factor [Verrucomicrobiota bacterium]